MNKKILTTLFVALVLAPFLVFADSYDGPYCFEDPAMFKNQDYNDDPQHYRGTCREIETYMVVSLDQALQDDYLLGMHNPICIIEDRVCDTFSKYSEEISFSGATEIKQSLKISGNPVNFALFDRQFFISKLTDAFKKEGIPFSQSNIPNVGIVIIKKDEIPQTEEIRLLGGKMDSPQKEKLYTGPEEYKEYYKISTLNYLEYGKHIHAPKGDIIESQYADIKTGENMLKDEDLGIKSEQVKFGSVSVVAPTSPLKSVTNYWIYTKINGKLTLTWQKSEYTLDNGKVKTITDKDKNISAPFLFSDASKKEQPSAINDSPEQEQQEVPRSKGFFARILDFILAWFK